MSWSVTYIPLAAVSVHLCSILVPKNILTDIRNGKNGKQAVLSCTKNCTRQRLELATLRLLSLPAVVGVGSIAELQLGIYWQLGSGGWLGG